jgi:phosphinothricin acetyltransferase
VIRPADPTTDAAACATIYGPYVTDSVSSFEERPPDAMEVATRIERYASTHAWLVAERTPGEIVGFAYGSPHRERAAYRWAADVSVYVARRAHRGGVARSLYTELLDILRRRGVHVACAGIALPNDASVALHESFGFALVGIYRRIGYKLGAWHDVGWWQLELAPPVGVPRELR